MDSFWIYMCVAFTCLIHSINGQNLRSCYTCDGATCLSQLEFRVTNCTTATDQCVTIYNEYTPIKRACYAALNPTDKAVCDTTTNTLCSTCNTDNCNLLGRADFTCIQCSSVQNRTCLTAPETYPSTRCLAPLYSGTPSCYVRADGETTQRGCIITKSELQRCVTNCSSCSTSGCNKNVFPVGRRKCVRGTVLDYCDVADDSCVSYNIYGAKQMCSNELEDSIREICKLKPNRCKECLVDGCNANVKFDITCRTCNSSSTDVNCVEKPNQSVSGTCSDGCVTYLKNVTGSSLATTHRTCYENLSAALKVQCQSGSEICESCLDNNCNSNIFPKNRLLCYHCDSTECSATTLTPRVCALYSATDKCIMVTKNGQTTEFNCLSSFNRTKSCENTNSCIVGECSESGCNNPSKFVKTSTCVQCDTRNQIECSTVPSMVGSTPCAQSNDTCYTMLQGGSVSRGCLANLTATQQTYCRANCNLCVSPGCNNQIFPANRLFCHQCDSRVNSSCGQSISTVPTMCLNYNTENKCISLLNNNGTYIRTCSSDQATVCKDTVVCSACDSYGCNNAAIDSLGPDGDGNGSPLLNISAFNTFVLAAILFILNAN